MKDTLAVSTMPSRDVAKYWSLSDLSSDWNTFEISFDEKSTLFLSEGGDEDFCPRILSHFAFKPNWTSDSLATIYLFVQHSNHEFGSYQVDLATNLCADKGASLILRRQHRSRLNSLPCEWRFVGPAVSGRLISGPSNSRMGALCAFSAQSPTLLAHQQLFPEVVAADSVEATMDPWSGAVVFSAQNCAVVAYYD